MKLLVSVVGCRAKLDRLEAVRDTWGSRQVDGVAIHYFVGAGKAPVPSWVEELDAPDGYWELPIKVHRVHEWMRPRDFKWAFKCDDDTYLVAERLLRELADLGPSEFLGSDDGWPRYAAGGAGYAMHRSASNRLAFDPLPGRGAEDLHFTQRLEALGFAFKTTPRLSASCLPHERPKSRNDLITCHGCDPAMMRRVHTGLRARALEVYTAEHPAWRSDFVLYDDGQFGGGACLGGGTWQFSDDRLHLRWFTWPEDILERTESGWRNDSLRLERLDGSTARSRSHEPPRSTMDGQTLTASFPESH